MADTVKRDRKIAARLNQTERKALDRIAELERRSVSETLRELVRREAVDLGVWPGPGKRQAA